jgi:hypothetical protein
LLGVDRPYLFMEYFPNGNHLSTEANSAGGVKHYRGVYRP